MISVFITAKNTLTDQHQILVPLIELEFCQNVQLKLSPVKIGARWHFSFPAHIHSVGAHHLRHRLFVEISHQQVLNQGSCWNWQCICIIWEMSSLWNWLHFYSVQLSCDFRHSGANHWVCWEMANIPSSISRSQNLATWRECHFFFRIQWSCNFVNAFPFCKSGHCWCFMMFQPCWVTPRKKATNNHPLVTWGRQRTPETKIHQQHRQRDQPSFHVTFQGTSKKAGFEKTLWYCWWKKSG